MQDLILLDTKNVKVQAQDKIYEDTLANFKKVYAKDIPYKYIDYNRDCATCYLDNKPFQNYPNSVCEDILSSINVLLDAQTKRNTTPENTEEKEVQEDIAKIENQIVNIKNDFVTTLLLNDTDTQEELKTQYLKLLTGGENGDQE